MSRIFKNPDLEKAAGYIAMVAHLEAYQKAGDGRFWGAYRDKVAPDLHEMWMEIIDECRRNGFVGPEARGGRIVWHQILGRDKSSTDMCMLCSRRCATRASFEDGSMRDRTKAGKEPKPCWDLRTVTI